MLLLDFCNLMNTDKNTQTVENCHWYGKLPWVWGCCSSMGNYYTTFPLIKTYTFHVLKTHFAHRDVPERVLHK